MKGEAGMAKQVDAADLKSADESHGGSIPSARTICSGTTCLCNDLQAVIEAHGRHTVFFWIKSHMNELERMRRRGRK